jgi:serine/threonine-protein kinase
MALTIGTQLGSHEITALLGKGGMGEVYRARDTKLKREVAIKVLPEEFSHDADRASRFQREAEVLASLNHPNIATIYDLQEYGGTRFLVLELVEGQTLAERIQRGPIPVEEALDIAKNISEALEAAHERGIIHRDFKPANVKLTPDGKVKVLDFGLAKAFLQQQSENLSDSPTLITSSVPGVILGTAAYMSPEQAKRRVVDKRADIWAFGVVLYEMLTGRRLFEGDSVSETLAAVLNSDPDWSLVPYKALRLLRRCLEKEPRRRLRDIGDAWALLEETPPRGSVPTKWPWLVTAAVALLAAVAVWAPRNFEQPVETSLQKVVRLDIELGATAPPANTGSNFVLSPDGARLAFATLGPDMKTHLFIRRLDQPKTTELAGTEGAYAPFFSPDGQWIGFFAPGKLKKIPSDGGPVTTLADAPLGRGASWGDDGNIVFTPDVQTRLLRIPAAGGGAPTPLTQFHGGEISHRFPQVLPGAKAVLFTALTAANFAAFNEASIEVISLTDGHVKTLHSGGSYGRYLASGHLLYARNGTAFAVPFDLDRLEVRGMAVPVLEELAFGSQSGSAQLDVSRDGMLVYQSAPPERKTIQWLDAAGQLEPMLAKPGDYTWLRFSPDGKRLVYRLAEGSGTNLWVYDWQRGIETRLTNDSAIHNSPAWSPDGRYIAYQAEGGMFRISADGAAKPQLLMEAKNTPFPESFTPDGKRLAFSVSNPVSGDLDIWTAPLEETADEMRVGRAEPFIQTPAHERDAAFSLDGRWLAYMATESGTYEVYVRAFPGTSSGGAKWQLSNGGGFNPVWSRNTHELFYRGADNRILVARYNVIGDTFVAEKPRVWSDRPIDVVAGITPSFDVAPGGKRLAVLEPAENAEPENKRHHVTLVLNFFDELRRIAPISKK